MSSPAQDIIYKAALASMDWRYGYHFINEELQQDVPDTKKISRMVKIYGTPEMFLDDFSDTQKTGIKPEGFKTVVKNEAYIPPFIANPLWIALEMGNKSSIVALYEMGVQLQSFIGCHHARMQSGDWFLFMVKTFQQLAGKIADDDDARILYWLKNVAPLRTWMKPQGLLREEVSAKTLHQALRKIGAKQSADFLVISIAQAKHLKELLWWLVEQEAWQAIDDEGKTLLFHLSIDEQDEFYCLRNESSLVEKMLQVIDINQPDMKGRNILFHTVSALAGLKNSISLNKNQVSSKTVSQLHVVIDNIRYLVELGSDPTSRDSKGLTAARIARLAKVAAVHPLLAFHSERDAMLAIIEQQKKR